MINDYQKRIAETEKKKIRKLLSIDFSLSGNEHSNVAGVSKSNTFYLDDAVSQYASSEIRDDTTLNKGINTTLVRQIDDTLSVILKAGLNSTEQNRGITEENDLVSSSLILNKNLGNKVLSPYIVYSRPNYRTQNDANTKIVGMSGRYLINSNNNVNFGFSFSENKFDLTSTFTSANDKNNDTYSGNIAYKKF